LTRFRAASNRSWPPSSFSRDWQCANTVRGTGELCPHPATWIAFWGGRANQPVPTFPRSPGIILRRPTSSLFHPPAPQWHIKVLTHRLWDK
jgi:hypothetical protein